MNTWEKDRGLWMRTFRKWKRVCPEALVPLIGMINDIGEGTAKTKRMDDYHQPITDAIRLSSAAFSMLS